MIEVNKMTWNDKPRSPAQIQKPEHWSNNVSDGWMTWLVLPPPVRIACVLMLLALVMMLTGCAATSMPSSEPARNPSPPPTRLSESPPHYLQDALSFISESRKTLSELIPKPAN
jgi:hypothetical protein